MLVNGVTDGSLNNVFKSIKLTIENGLCFIIKQMLPTSAF